MSTTSQIQEIYVGLLGRAADSEGLAYWTAEIDGGVLTIEQLRANIVNEQAEYAANLGSLSRSDLVTSLYANLFERAPDAAGLTYWSTGGGSTVNADQLVLALSNGASAIDRIALDNKTEAATYYTNNADSYAASAAQSAVSSVSSSFSTVTDSKVATDALVSAASTQALTTADEVLTGNAGARDVFTAVTSGSTNTNSYGASDSIVDASSTDNDILTVTASTDVSNTATVTGIENVNWDFNGLTAGTGPTDWSVALDNVGANTVHTFDNISTTSIVTGLTTVNQKSSTAYVGSDFKSVTVGLVADADATVYLDNVGTSASKTSATVTGTADTLTITAPGYIDLTATDVAELVQITAADVTVTDADAATALLVTATAGDVTVTDAVTATVIDVTATGDVTFATGSIDAALAPTVVSGGDITIDTVAATTMTLTANGAVVITDEASSDNLTSVTLTANGATTVDLTGADVVSTLSLFGASDIEVEYSITDVDAFTGDKITLADATTAGTTTIKLGTAAGAVDFLTVTPDVVELAVSNATGTIKLASGQELLISADQLATSTFTGKTSTATSNTLSVTLNDGTKAATHGTTAVDLVGVAFTNYATVTIDSSIDTLADGTAETVDFTAVAMNNADTTVTMGVNDLALLGAINVGATGSLTITGSGDITGDASGVVTAESLDTTGSTGAVTLLTLQSDELPTLNLGSGADDITLTAASTAADLTINFGGGDDTLTVAASVDENASINFAFGDGDDTLELGISTLLTADLASSDSATVTGLENFHYTENTTLTTITVASSVINNATYDLKDLGSGAGTVTLLVNAADESIDLSGLTVSAANASGVADDSFVIDASVVAGDAISAITGANVAKNTITTNAIMSTTVIGGAKADTITSNKNSTMTGAAGSDIFVVGAGGDTITDFTVGASGDDVHLDVSQIEGLFTSGDLIILDDGASVTHTESIAYHTITTADDLDSDATNANTIVLDGKSIASTSALETALETGGDYAITTAGAFAANDVFLVLYTDGTNSHLAAVQTAAGATDALFASGDLEAINVVTFTGINDVGTIVAANFADLI